MASPTLTPQMMGELANHLRHEGMAAYQRNDMRAAMTWFAQCLSVLRQIGHNEDLISMLLYHIGMIYGLAGKNSQAIAFFEVSARIQENQHVEEATADTLHLIAQAIDAIEYPTRAQAVLEKALAMYETLNLRTKANQLREEIQRSGAKSSDSRSYRFAICLDTQEFASFRVTPDGVVQWGPHRLMHGSDPQSSGKQIPVGRNPPWYVVATGPLPRPG
jgi:tetratricopeptide (TPR) repeat protein